MHRPLPRLGGHRAPLAPSSVQSASPRFNLHHQTLQRPDPWRVRCESTVWAAGSTTWAAGSTLPDNNNVHDWGGLPTATTSVHGGGSTPSVNHHTARRRCAVTPARRVRSGGARSCRPDEVATAVRGRGRAARSRRGKQRRPFSATDVDDSRVNGNDEGNVHRCLTFSRPTDQCGE
uniref:Uncharacterized protein n=1 Tax=Arundo donax TaxID=35708 RepID=A0A0A9GCT3_ARUDO